MYFRTKFDLNVTFLQNQPKFPLVTVVTVLFAGQSFPCSAVATVSHHFARNLGRFPLGTRNLFLCDPLYCSPYNEFV